MTNAPGIIERAYELCRSGDCPSIDAVRARLKQERYENVDSHLASGSLKRDLRKLLAAGQLVKTK